MTVTSQMKNLVVTLVVAFAVSGCQMPGKWQTAWKERSKPKPDFKNPDEKEEVTYWPYRSVKNKAKMSAVPSQLKDKMAKKAEQDKHDSDLAALIDEGD